MSNRSMSADSTTTEAPFSDSSLVLLVVSGAEPGTRYAVGAHTMILGRDPDADVFIDDKRVSRQHARIEPGDDGSLLLVDNGSSNGTFVNGQPVDQHHLDIGDRIGLGRGVMLLFTRSGRFDDQILQAQKLQALGALSGRVAHDFNNVLTTVLANVSLLADLHESGSLSCPSHPQLLSQVLDDLHLAARQGAELTDRLLSFSKVEEASRETIDIGDAVSDAVAMARPTLGEHAELNVSNGRNLKVFGYPQRLVNVFMNLILNARDSLRETGGSIQVRASALTLDESSGADWLVPGRYIQVSVEDDGQGMDDTTRARIFEPFFTTKGRDGTGMGLAIAYRTIRDHGGHIQVMSTPGIGTAVRLLLPSVDG